MQQQNGRKAMLKSNIIKYEELNISEEMLDDYVSWHDENLAFIKPDIKNNQKIWVIYSSDGIKLATTDNRDLAFIMAKHNDFDALSCH